MTYDDFVKLLWQVWPLPLRAIGITLTHPLHHRDTHPPSPWHTPFITLTHPLQDETIGMMEFVQKDLAQKSKKKMMTSDRC